VLGATDGAQAVALTFPNSLLSRIRVQVDSLPPAEQRVARAILRSPERVVRLTIAEMAQRAGVSEGSVVRFCDSVGCDGYQALKLGLAADLSERMRQIHADVDSQDSGDLELIARKVFLGDIQALEDTLRIIDIGQVEKAVASLVSAREVVFFAVGSSLAIVVDAASRFLRIGLKVQFELDTHLQLLRASLLEPTDLAFGISHSGSSREPVECLELARQRGASTLAITGRHPSPLTEFADTVLLTASSETRYRDEAMASRIAQLSLLDTLYVALAMQTKDTALEFMTSTRAALSRRRVD